MYDPKGNGRGRAVPDVSFDEATPSDELGGVVHRFLDFTTDGDLVDDYRFHALPDACTYIVFDQLNPDIAGVTKLRASSEELNLGRSFHFVNIRLLPGVWQADRGQADHGLVETPYTDDLPLVEVNRRMAGADFATKQAILANFVSDLVTDGRAVANPIIERIFHNIDDIYSSIPSQTWPRSLRCHPASCSAR